MANAKRDGNRITTLIGVSASTAGGFVQDVTPVPVRVDPTTKRLYVDANVSSAVITDIEDGAGDSVMDAINDSMKVTIVADDVGIGGTQYAEDSVHASGHLGTMSLAVATSGGTVFGGAGDYTPISVTQRGAVVTTLYSGTDEIASITAGGDGANNTSRGLRVYNRNEVFNGTSWDRLRGDVRGVHISDIKDSAGDSLIDAANNALQVNIVAGAAAGGTSALDDADFTAGTTAGTPVMGVYQSTPTAVTDGDLGIVGIDADRNLKVNIVAGSSSGTEYTEDVATANPIVGTATLMERDDALAAVTPIEGDWIAFRGTAEGALWTQDFNSDAILADTTAIKTAVEIIDNAIAGTEMQVDVVAALPAGTNNIGDVDVLTLPGDTVADIGALESDTDSSTMWADGAEVVVKRAVISAATSGDNTLVAAVVGKNIRVISLFLVALSEVAVRFESGAAGTALSGIMTITDHSGLVLPENKGGWFETADNTLLNLELGAAIQVSGSLTYVEV